jgi:hypothetical protein
VSDYAIRQRLKDPAVVTEVDALRERSDPDAWAVLREAKLSARKDDGVDWTARIAAARAALPVNRAVASPSNASQTHWSVSDQKDLALGYPECQLRDYRIM